MDTIWSRVQLNFQCQQEEVQDWASQLKHLQAVLIEFDADGAQEKFVLIRFFCKGLEPSVIAQMKQRGRELGNWGGLFDKAIDAKSKC